ncbi:MAG: sigma-54-dependent Fis family transcriptional regulator [Deltaproteobacteria bacterium]|nr:sigma-54-dependent Fis family transcriptional regulator [Deltaproteobacteria bacterium]
MDRMEHPACEHCEFCGLVPVVAMTRKTMRVVAQSAAMRAVLARARRFADSNAPCVILGESGTGKEIVARTMHGSGPRATKPFLAVNVAALPAELLESELFGHAKGAFTGADRTKAGMFEEAHGGTLFLDEIAEMPLALQSKLLRALADGEIRRLGESRSFGVDVRVVCATHRDLEEMVARGLFREDLYYRLKVLTLRVPPLRDRREDVLPLARRFLTEEAPNKTFAKDAEARLVGHRWPGNVRELQNAVKHGAALATADVVHATDLPEELGRDPGVPPAPFVPRTLADVERSHILAVLEACGGSQTEAARVLGIGRNTLWRKLRAWHDDEAAAS